MRMNDSNSTITHTHSIELLSIDQRLRFFLATLILLLYCLPLVVLIPIAVKLQLSLWPLLVYLPIAAILAWRYASAYYRNFRYCLLDDGIWIESGVIWRKATFVPRARVQHTEVNHGPIDRKMGLAKLSLHTAGIRMQNITIPGLTEARAHELRDQLLNRAL
jgi:membrane protein YdbS with pleckstrin-like domain